MKKILPKIILFLLLLLPIFGQFNFPFLPQKIQISAIGLPIDATSFYIAVPIKLRSGWSIYWQYSGSVTQGTEFSNFNLPEGVKLQSIYYPTPSYKLSESSTFLQASYLYKKSPTFLLKFKIDNPKYTNKIIKGDFSISYQACTNTQCDIPITKKIPFAVEMSSDRAGYVTAYLNQIKETLPTKIPTEFNLAKTRQANTLTLTFQANNDISQLYFFPKSIHIVEQKQTWQKNKQGLIELNIPFSQKVTNEGVLKIITKDNQTLSYEITQTTTGAPQKSFSNLFYYLFMAFSGGLILNLMPCVFPILAIKILGFVNQAQKEKPSSIKYALAFTCGVLVSFWILATIIIASKATGDSSFAWGFQLQNPFFIAFLITLLIIISLNFFGIFEIILPWTPQQKNTNGYLGSFNSGLLATLIATPCVAPFMSIALVAALSLPAFSSWLIFTFIGLGLSFPYLLFSLFPKLLKWIPKPGEWMITFKKIMGFVLLASAIWFMETFEALLGIKILIKFCLLICLSSLAFWYYGIKSFDRHSKNHKISFFILILTLLTCGIIIFNDITRQSYLESLSETERQIELAKTTIIWQEFSEEKFANFQKQGKKIFVDFTATWCASCLWNEKTVLQANRQLFQDNQVIMLKADCTKKNHPFKKVLTQYQASGVPLYLYFNGEKVQKLSNLLNNTIIKDLFR